MLPTPILAAGLAAIFTYAAATILGGALHGVAMPPRRARHGGIDGLRGYLAVSVMIFHHFVWMALTRSGADGVPFLINPLNSLGAGSVGLFFMITGFLFYPRILAGFNATCWPTVYIGRIFRIVPMTALSVGLISLIIMGRTGARPNGAFLRAAAEWLTGWKEPNLLGYPDSGRINSQVLWTLWYEWMFYIAVLPLCALMRDMMRGRLPSWLLPAGLLLCALLARHVRGLGGWPTYLPMFALGMLAFESQTHARMRRVLSARLVAIPALACLAWGMMQLGNPYGERQLPLYGFFFLTVACGNDLFGLLARRGARLLGEYSFGIYLLHGLILSLLFVEGAHAIAPISTAALPVLLPPAAIVVICLCAMLHIVVEKPAMQARRVVVDKGGKWLRAHVSPNTVMPQWW